MFGPGASIVTTCVAEPPLRAAGVCLEKEYLVIKQHYEIINRSNLILLLCEADDSVG